VLRAGRRRGGEARRGHRAAGRNAGQRRPRRDAGPDSDIIGSYARAGAETVYLQVLDLDDLDHLELLAAEVMPQVS